MPSEPLTVDVPGLAVRLGCSPETIRREERSGALAEKGIISFRLGNRLRYSIAQVDAFLAAQTDEVSAS